MADQKENNKQQEKKEELKPVTKKKRTLFQKSVNVFLYIFLGLFIILLLLFGFTQTSTFRELVREEVTSILNNEMNGEISIGKIEGTIFTSLFLRNVLIKQQEDTLLLAGSIELKLSPLNLLRSRISIRRFELKNTSVYLFEDSSGTLNVETLFPSSDTPPDTTSSDFPFKFSLNDIRLTNIAFSMQSYNNKGSIQTYDTLNLSDFRIDSLYLVLNGTLDINKNDFRIKLDRLSLNPNINGVAVNYLKGDFLVGEKGIDIKGFHLQTNNTDLSMSILWEGFNIFGEIDSTMLADSPVELNINNSTFAFSDLSAFVPGTEILKGRINLQLTSKGTLQLLNIDKLSLDIGKTHLSLMGEVKNINDPERLFVNAEFFDTYLFQEDIDMLLPELELPDYNEFGKITFNKFTYVGEPLNFITDLKVATERGSFETKAALDFRGERMKYDVAFSTNKLNLEPIISMQTLLNANGTIKGIGTAPEDMAAELRLRADNSSIDIITLDTLRLTVDALNKKTNIDFLAVSDTAHINISGLFDFTDEQNPAYNFKGNVTHVNLFDFTQDSSLITDLNFSLSAEGENFHPDRMNSRFIVSLNESLFYANEIDSTAFVFEIRQREEGAKIIRFVSDFTDVVISGNFSFDLLVDLAAYQAQAIADAFSTKIEQYTQTQEHITAETLNVFTQNTNSFNPAVLLDSPISLNYRIDFKDFDLLSMFIDERRIEVDGNISGIIIGESDHFITTINSRLDYIKVWDEENSFFVSDVDIKMRLANDGYSSLFKDIEVNMTASTEWVYIGSDIKNLDMQLSLNDNYADLNFSVDLDEMISTSFIAAIDLSGNQAEVNFNELNFIYNTFELENRDDIKIRYGKEGLFVDKLLLVRDTSEISLSGSVLANGDQNILLTLNKISGIDLSVDVLGISPANAINANINIIANIDGTTDEPVIKFDSDIYNVSYGGINFGFLDCDFTYDSKKLNINTMFLDSSNTVSSPLLLVQGYLPIDLSFASVEERIIQNEPLFIKFIADSMNLALFGDALPGINRLTGLLAADIELKGSVSNMERTGFVNLQNSTFIVEANNLPYSADIKLTLRDELLTIDNLKLENSGGTKFPGTLNGKGKAVFEGFELSTADITINGNLALLSYESRFSSPGLYGDLFMGTRGDIVYSYKNKKSSVNVPINIERADLTIPPTQSAYSATSEKFIYRFALDSLSISDENDFDKIISLTRKKIETAALEAQAAGFDFNVNVRLFDDVKVIFILSRETNLRLVVELKGDLLYQQIDGRTIAQGELELLEGSVLEFFKTFEAEGSIRFEGDITDPYLEVAATYRNYYADTTSSTRETEVAVKIHLRGPVEELGKNFMEDEDNIRVYIGTENIRNNIPDVTKDAGDAISFVLVGKFTEDLTSQDRSSAAGEVGPIAGAATSLAGSLLGGFLNQQLGDYVRNLEIRAVGAETRFNLSGRVKNFRYSFGGSTDVFSDLSQANIKIEYPFTDNLIIRFERLDAFETNSTNIEKINEVGLRYRFEF